MKSQLIEHNMPTFCLIKTPILYKPTHGIQKNALGHVSYSEKLRQGEKSIANSTDPIAVRVRAKAMKISKNGNNDRRTIDLMKFQQRDDLII